MGRLADRVITTFALISQLIRGSNFGSNCDIRISEIPIKIGSFCVNSMMSGPTISQAACNVAAASQSFGLLLPLNGQVGFPQEFTNSAVCVQHLFVCEVGMSIAAYRE